MITFRQPEPTASPADLETDPVVIMAERMRELGMSGTAVTAESLFENSDFTRAEIEQYGRDAADLARARAVRRVA